MWRTRVNARFSLARYLDKFLGQTQAWLDCVSAELLLLPFFKDFRGLQHTQRHDRVLTRHVVFLAWSCLCDFFDCFDRSIFWSYFLAHPLKHRVHPYPFHELFKSPSFFKEWRRGWRWIIFTDFVHPSYFSPPSSSYPSPALIFHSTFAMAMKRKQKNIITGSSLRVPVTNLSIDPIDQPRFAFPIHHERYTRFSITHLVSFVLLTRAHCKQPDLRMMLSSYWVLAGGTNCWLWRSLLIAISGWSSLHPLKEKLGCYIWDDPITIWF